MSGSLAVVHVDNHLLVVDKPAGLPTVPDASGDESLLEHGKAWLKREFKKPGAVFLGVVHRLDRPVSGIVVFARTSKAAARLGAAFREHDAEKVYWAVVGRAPEPERGQLEQWLVKDAERNRVRVALPDAAEAKRALTAWRVLEHGAGRCLVELRPRTGRPHQLRVALASLGAPILGDLKYGARTPLEDKSIALHARSLALPHPTRPELLVCEAPPPDLAAWGFQAAEAALARGHRVSVEAPRGR